MLDAQVAQCDVVLAIIGANWLDAHDNKGQRRLDGANDYVRIEIAAALARDIPVIPVLLDGAVMPSEDALPDDLKLLARRHALELRYTRFNADAQGLEVALREILPYRRPKWFFPALCGGVAVLCIAAFVGWRVLSPHDGGLGGQGVGSPPAVQPAIKPEPVKPVTPPVQPARRALESTATSSGLLVALGDSMDHIKSHIVSEPFTSGSSLGFRLPLSGIYFFFTEADKKLENIRVNAPFEGSVEGVRIGDPRLRNPVAIWRALHHAVGLRR